jgi:hypothetical protein
MAIQVQVATTMHTIELTLLGPRYTTTQAISQQFNTLCAVSTTYGIDEALEDGERCDSKRMQRKGHIIGLNRQIDRIGMPQKVLI